MSSSGAGKAGIPAVGPIAAFLRPIAARTKLRPARALPLRKAAVARRSDGLAIEWKPLTRLDAADCARIRDLSARALQPNVFYEPEYLLAARSLALADGAGVLLVSAGGRLIGALGGRIEGLAYGRPVTHVRRLGAALCAAFGAARGSRRGRCGGGRVLERIAASPRQSACGAVPADGPGRAVRACAGRSAL